MKKTIERILVTVLTLAIIILPVSGTLICAFNDTLESMITSSIEAAKLEGETLFTDKFLESAGSSIPDWYAIAIGRTGIKDDYAAYLSALNTYITNKYTEDTRLDRIKSTEWHRISLAIASLGGNPAACGKDGSINLIADGTYNWTHTDFLGRQGINGFIWALIALDSLRYEVPDDAIYTRDDIILEIISRQASDGGFALIGNSTDPDMTGMALQALAPYYAADKSYSYTLLNDETVERDIRTVIDLAIESLSSMQSEDGGFSGFGSPNCEATSQVIIALCSLGIDPRSDPRFIKNGNSAFDGLLQYRTDGGGFAHMLEDGVTPEFNAMANEQALLALIATARLDGGYRTLYDFRVEPVSGVSGGGGVVSTDGERSNSTGGNDKTNTVGNNAAESTNAAVNNETNSQNGSITDIFHGNGGEVYDSDSLKVDTAMLIIIVASVLVTTVVIIILLRECKKNTAHYE